MDDQKDTAVVPFTLLKSDEIGELAKGLLAFHKAVGTIAKTATNPFFKSSYAPLTEILSVIAEPLQKAGLVVSQFPDGENGLSTMLIHAESGQWMSAWYQINPGKEGPQALGSAITYARRYSIGAVLSLNIDEDDDANQAEGEGNGKKDKNRPQYLAYAIAELNKQTTTKGLTETVEKYKQFHDDERFQKAAKTVEANIRATSQTAQEQLP